MSTERTTEKAQVGRVRVRFVVEVDLDPVPGWGHEPDDWGAMLRHYLTQVVGHYRPTVEYDGETDGIILPAEDRCPAPGCDRLPYVKCEQNGTLRSGEHALSESSPSPGEQVTP